MGLIGGMARTAVVAGTATTVSNRVSRRQANRWVEEGPGGLRRAAVREPPPQYAQPRPNTRSPRRSTRSPHPNTCSPRRNTRSRAPPARCPASRRHVREAPPAGELKEQGILTEEEFAAQKAKILAS